LHDVVPAHGKTPRRINKARRVCVEAARDRKHDREFSESVNRVEHHDTDNDKVNEQGAGTARGQGLSRADEETSANGATNGNHLQVTRLHGAVERIRNVALLVVAPLERLEVEAIARVKVLLVAGPEGRARRGVERRWFLCPRGRGEAGRAFFFC